MDPGSPFRLASFVWESQPGRYVMTVVAHGMARLVQSQEAMWTIGDEYPIGYDDSHALAARLNLLAPFKPRADLVVVGKAYAPPGADSDRLVSRVRVGDFQKAISITGDRLWLRDGGRWGSSPPRPFPQMLLSPERAIRSAENPVGLDPAAIPIEGRLALPNLEPVAGSFSAIIGPVSPMAPSRRNLLSPQGVAWVSQLELGRPPGPVPEGMNFAFFNVAPLDQQLLELAPGSAIVLENLHPQHGMFTSRLPSTVPRVRGVDPATGRPLEPALRCDTVWIDGDREMAWIVFRGTVDLARPDLPVALSTSLERWQRSADVAPMSTQTLLTTQPGLAIAQALPFPGGSPKTAFGTYGPADAPAGYYAPASPRAAEEYPSNDRASYPPPPPPAEPSAPRRSITAEIIVPANAGGLPFQQDSGEWHAASSAGGAVPRSGSFGAGPPTPQSPERAVASDERPTLHGRSGMRQEDTSDLEDDAPTPPPRGPTAPPPPPSAFAGLPFSGGPLDGVSAEPPVRPAPFFAEAAGKPVEMLDLPTTATATTRDPRRRLVPRGNPGRMPDIGTTLQPDLSFFEDPSTFAGSAHANVSASNGASHGPTPALVAPRSYPPPPAPPEPVAAEPSTPPPPASMEAPETTANPPTEADAPSPPPPDDEDSDFADEPTPPERRASRQDLGLEECAQLRAQLSAKGADKSAILLRHNVDDATWTRLEREHLTALDEAARAGDTTLLARYDDAFLAAQDEIRGRVIDENAYARIQVARERNQLSSVLEELAVGRNDLLRLERVWRRRLASDRSLADRFEDETERLRNS